MQRFETPRLAAWRSNQHAPERLAQRRLACLLLLEEAREWGEVEEERRKRGRTAHCLRARALAAAGVLLLLLLLRLLLRLPVCLPACVSVCVWTVN